MIKFEYVLIKEYPGSPVIGTVHTFYTNREYTAGWLGSAVYNDMPEYWVQTKGKNFEVLSWYCDVDNKIYLSDIPLTEYKIYSIKRLSDNEVFKIKDNVQLKQRNDNYWDAENCQISNFKILKDNVIFEITQLNSMSIYKQGIDKWRKVVNKNYEIQSELTSFNDYQLVTINGVNYLPVNAVYNHWQNLDNNDFCCWINNFISHS